MSTYALEVENLVKVYGGRRSLFGPRNEPVRAVDGLSFQVPRGAIFGLLGPTAREKPPC
jgi:ATPase components of various ABC-type transport systems, contain duplicated ATPase